MAVNRNMEAILEAREKRVFYQKKLIQEYKKTLMAFKLNIPGPEKDGFLYRRIFNNGYSLLKDSLDNNNISIIFERVFFKDTGPEAFLIVDKDARDIKILCTEIEDKDDLGRIYDFDVIDHSGKAVGRKEIGRDQRKCFLCDKYVWVCSRSRAHSLEEMINFIKETSKTYFI